MTKTRRQEPVPVRHNPDPTGVGLAVPEASCESFELSASRVKSSELSIGDVVSAHRRGSRIRLMRRGSIAGWVSDEASEDILRCLDGGHRYSGPVLSVSGDFLTARIDVET